MYVIRRHRRHLLFPPGLLALAFLLLLGCQVLRPWYGVLGPHYVLSLTLPARPVSDVIYPYPDIALFKQVRIGESEHSSQEQLELFSQLPYFRHWQDFTFTGEQVARGATAEKARLAFQAMRTDTTRAKGIRIRFTEQASYTSLVQILDWAQSATGDNYLLDIYQGPVTLYAFTNAYRPPAIDVDRLFPDGNAIIGCSLCNDFYPYSPPPASFWEQMKTWVTQCKLIWKQALLSSEWLASLSLLCAIMLTTMRKMARRWHTA
ncbi:hypothetical protein CLV45_0800 [Hymenobacter chitinivorans DSM 11115]|uniref:Uncharacterized protein n=1 Tax=Hymenobacter chitinivorans DSM 11115 TaxID=1121954 RepID=A0A2M9BN57_9BACT|nr:hypothetical protein CLV45_0800 [Hymenobacter chitinivorans DSM 11115]